MPASFPGVRIFADDLSGAADCAASFTGAAGHVPVFLEPPRGAPPASFALDCDTRWREARDAAAAFRELAAPLLGAGGDALVYKKIDSTLRGAVAAELAAFARLAPRGTPIVVAPAFPAQGRTLAGGRPAVHGAALPGWPDSLGERLASTLEGARQVIALPAARVAALVARAGEVLVVDADHDGDLASVAACARWPVRPWFAGSAGLARALAGAAPRPIAAIPAPVLFVVGSFAGASAAQVATLAASDPASLVLASPRQDRGRWVDAAVDRLRGGRCVVVRLAGAPAQGTGSRELAHLLAAHAAEALAHCASLVLTGGDMARAVLRQLGVAALQVEGELEPGIAAAAPLRAHGPVAVLKAGGFGDNELFARILARSRLSSP